MPRRRKLTWDNAVHRYENHLRAKRSARSTIEAYLRQIRYFREHVEREVHAVELADLRAYQLGLQTGATSRSGQPLSPGALANTTTILRGFFSWLHEEELLKDDPARRLEHPKLPRRLPGDVLDREDVQRLLGAPDPRKPLGRRDRTLIEVLYATGLRRGELCALDLADVDLDKRIVHVRHGKGDKARRVPLTRSAAKALEAYLQDTRPKLSKGHKDELTAFFLTRAGRRIHAASVAHAMTRLRKRAQLGKPITPHTLRRTFATHLLKEGVSLRHIQLLLGHERLSTTATYLSLDLEDLRRELLKHHPREQFEA